MKKEQIIAAQFAAHLKTYHGDLIWRFDLQADMRLTPGQAKRAKQLQGDRGYPDIFLPEPRGEFHGLYIEFKDGRDKVWRQDGEYKKDKHLHEQIRMRSRLQMRGYRVEWGYSKDDAIQKLNRYLNLDK